MQRRARLLRSCPIEAQNYEQISFTYIP